MPALSGYKATIQGSDGDSVADNSKPMYDLLGDRTRYQLSNAARRFPDDSKPVVVQTSPDGTTWTTVPDTDYALTHLGATVRFYVARPVGTQVRLGTHAFFNMVTIAGCRSWTGDFEVAMLDQTAFNSAGARSFIPGLMSGTISCEGFWVDRYFYDRVKGTQRAVFNLFVEENGGLYSCYVYGSKATTAVNFTDLVTESRELTITGSFVYRGSV